MKVKPKEISKAFSSSKIIFAVLIGLSVSMYLMLKNSNFESYSDIDWTIQVVFFLVLALIFEAIRDLAYMYRIRLMTNKAIGWRKSFQVIMLWEFASTLTPSVVGGSAVALFIVSKELKNAGKATAIVMITALLDELFYIVSIPLIILLISTEKLFINLDFNIFNLGAFPTKTVFIIGYLFILILTTIIFLAIFLKPQLFKKVLNSIFSLKLLKRWQHRARKIGEEIIITSHEMKGKSLMFWTKAFSATMISWTARFAVVNALILAIIGHGDQIMIFARQLIMWVILLISPTPGGSGVAEFMLPEFLGEHMGNFSNEIALSWRLLSYYSYLIIGSIILPIWLNRVFKRTKKTENVISKS